MNEKPKQIKAFYIIKLVELFLTSITLVVIHLKGVFAEQFALVSFMMVGYTWATLGIFYFLEKKNVWPIRLLLIIDAAISIPFKAFIAIAFNVILFVMTFTGQSGAYFKRQ